MAGSITMALYTAKDGLLAMQSSLGTVSQNVANVNTPGYSRKIQHLETRTVGGNGAGVQLSEVTRAIDEGLLKDIRRESGDLNAQDAQLDYFQRIEELFGSPKDNTSISHQMNLLQTALQALSAAPNRSVEQTDFVLTADDTLDKLSDMSLIIQELRLQADIEIASTVDLINTKTQEIAELNDRIIRNQTVSNDVTDLKDQRDIALTELSALIDVQYFERNSGEIAVFTQSGRVLVDSEAVSMSHTPAATVGATTTHAEGNFSGIFVSANVSANDVTNDILGGKLKGLIEVRDGFLNDVQREIDELAQVLKDSVNLVHNRGTSVPGRSSMTGTRTFLQTPPQAPATAATGQYDQQITVSGQVRFLLSDADGNQVGTDTFENIMGGPGPFQVDDFASTLQTWIQGQGSPALASATVGFTSDGQLKIDTGDTSTYFSVFEESTTTAGVQSDATVTFDGSGSGLGSETVQGFSSFFGMNDFFVTNNVRTTFESNVVDLSTTVGNTTLTFFDESGVSNTLPTLSTNQFGSITTGSSWTIQDIADAINSDASLSARLDAAVIPEGNGYRLRITHSGGEELYIASSSSTALDNIGLHHSEINMSQNLKVRDDILAAPGLISTAVVQFDADVGFATGEYRILDTDNTNVEALSKAFTDKQSFDASGRLVSRQQSLTDYATNIIGEISTSTSSLETRRNTQQSLVDSLTTKSDNIKGVNLDEELSQLILFEQAYAASARVISTIQEMFDTLENAVR